MLSRIPCVSLDLLQKNEKKSYDEPYIKSVLNDTTQFNKEIFPLIDSLVESRDVHAYFLSSCGHYQDLSQGKIFAAKIREKIESEIKQGHIKKRKKQLPLRSIVHPMIYSNITGDNITEVKKVTKKGLSL
jgi:hypothetical protein